MSSTHSNNPTENPSRRDFMVASGGALSAAVLAGSTIPAFAAEDNTLKVGLIGCGGRGSGAAQQALLADPNTKLVAMGDAFQDQIDGCLKKFKDSRVKDRVSVPAERQFTGFDAYKGVVDACDVIVLATPPHFRPVQLAYAVEKGKHVFCEKPVAVDGPGIRSVLATCAKAKAKNLNIVSGLCYRYQFAKQATIKQIHDGAVGDILTMQTTYNTGSLWHKGHKPEWSEMEYQLRNWLYFNWLSGDHINEQHIHSLDKIAWAMNDVYPAKATSSGGRIQRIDPKYGNVYDHFNTVYEWDNGVKAFSSCRQWDSSSTNVSDHVFGTKGTAHIQEHTIDSRKGKAWAYKKTGRDDMYQNEHNALFAAIRKGDTINNGEYMCHSTLMAIMGRMAAYTGKTVTWDEALNSKEDHTPPAYDWVDVPMAPVARPGITQFT
jgi:myo-inositol 2-dehydrogenase / D-chiro-inositol 1-dehydrogenase